MCQWAMGSWHGALLDMLCHVDEGVIRLCQVTPRKWLEDGKEIRLNGMYTEHGRISMQIRSRIESGSVEAVITPPTANPMKSLILRLRTPGKRRINAVTVNGASNREFDADREEILLPANTTGDRLNVVVQYK